MKSQKPIVYQQMDVNLNSKKVSGLITEIYTTQRRGLNLTWVKLGKDTLIHVWPKQNDTAKIKVGSKATFQSIKKLHGNLWNKKKSEG